MWKVQVKKPQSVGGLCLLMDKGPSGSCRMPAGVSFWIRGPRSLLPSAQRTRALVCLSLAELPGACGCLTEQLCDPQGAGGGSAAGNSVLERKASPPLKRKEGKSSEACRLALSPGISDQFQGCVWDLVCPLWLVHLRNHAT